MEVTVFPLSEERSEDFLRFFDDVAFTDNPGWASCYCVFHHFRGTEQEWCLRRAEENRALAARLIREGELAGYLAYSGREPVGWCNVNELDRFTFLPHYEGGYRETGKRTAAIVCFVVAPAFRRQGVAGRLLERAIEDLRERGCKALQAFPRRPASSAAQNYPGPLELYQRHGFRIVKTLKDSLLVRLPL